MAQWRSDILPLLAIGGAIGLSVLGNAGQNAADPLVRQNAYVTQQACEQDYPAQQCVSTYQPGHGGYAGHYVYYGPAYYPREAPQGDPGPGRTALNSSDGRSTAASSVSETRVSRGGFGATARSGRGGYYGG